MIIDGLGTLRGNMMLLLVGGTFLGILLLLFARRHLRGFGVAVLLAELLLCFSWVFGVVRW